MALVSRFNGEHLPDAIIAIFRQQETKTESERIGLAQSLLGWPPRVFSSELRSYAVPSYHLILAGIPG